MTPTPPYNPKPFLVVFCGSIIVVLLLCGVDFVRFMRAPASFYFRAWEYAGDILYRSEALGNAWHGPETGDLSRDSVFYGQKPHETVVTIDPYGYRASPPPPPGGYRVAIGGDSQMWTSGLSDEETIATRLGELLQTPVLSLARFHLYRGLRHPDLSPHAIIINGITERNLANDSFPYSLPDEPELAPLHRDKSRFQVLRSVKSKRYLTLCSSVPRNLLHDAQTFFHGPQPMLFISHRLTPTELDAAAARIEARRDTVEAMGYTYYFMPVPAKQTIYGTGIDPYTRDALRTLYSMLDKRGVRCIRVLDSLRGQSAQGVYKPYDSHINALGARIIAQDIFTSVADDVKHRQ